MPELDGLAELERQMSELNVRVAALAVRVGRLEQRVEALGLCKPISFGALEVTCVTEIPDSVTFGGGDA